MKKYLLFLIIILIPFISNSQNKKIVVNVDSQIEGNCNECIEKYKDTSIYIVSNKKSKFLKVDSYFKVDTIVNRLYDNYFKLNPDENKCCPRNISFKLNLEIKNLSKYYCSVLEDEIFAYNDVDRLFKSNKSCIISPKSNENVLINMMMSSKIKFSRSGCIEVLVGNDYIEIVPIKIVSDFWYPKVGK